MVNLFQEIWYGSTPVWKKPLLPPLAVASCLYRAGMRFDQWRKTSQARKLPRPVISVGNLTVGGTGKTPVVHFLAQSAESLGKRVAILTRGYGAKTAVPIRVRATRADPRVCGDEPLLLARTLPSVDVWVGADRYASGIRALETAPDTDLFILDDGFQHRQLVRDFDLVLVDGERGFGNERLLPWGPLREPLSALDRAHAVAWVFKGKTEDVQEAGKGPADDPESFRVVLEPVGWNRLGEIDWHPLSDLPADSPAFLVSGIGSPASFEETVRRCGLAICEHRVFPDHHEFSESELREVVRECELRGYRLVTTAKDAVRMEASPVEWTESNRPIIIQLGLKSGDGADRLKSIVNSLFVASHQGEIEVSGGRTSP